ncbi:hypothetical protein CTheo_8789 [Ceratobasidium theobromae]|uniref:Uncharacterized protein n=1 Tax=Ceratobasidium theobromae TaxID=1582974 RepID=A0A5N5Q7M2_9AGAM|nr:hypothetical protein CTheo_8789 [Ceratobasidium theobromae]
MLKRGATVVPLILSSNKTQLSVLSGRKKVWLVYLSIGNVSKKLRQRPSQGAMILIAYLPIAELTCITNVNERRQKSWDLFHACMGAILEPIKEASKHGVEALCADGHVRRIHPILAVYIVDFPEQCLVTCACQNRCPICTVPVNECGKPEEYSKRTKAYMLDAMDDYMEGYRTTAESRGVWPVWPFWADLQFVNIATCITPDLLHQLNKGVFKDHIVKWCTELLGAREVDHHLKGMTRFQGLRHFANGSSVIKQWTGNEAKHLAKTFLPLIAGCKEGQAVNATRCVIDFMYRTHMPEMSDDDLEALDNDLAEFHKSKEAFVECNVVDSGDMFDAIAKIHMLSHYSESIRELGTTDGYNTEAPEHLHIDCVKEGWRMSNHNNPLDQMALYLQRKESWALLHTYHRNLGQLPASIRDWDAPMKTDDEIDDEMGGEVNGYIYGEDDDDDNAEEEVVVHGGGRGGGGGGVWHPTPAISIAKHPRRQPGSYLVDKHGTTNLIRDVTNFLKKKRPQHAHQLPRLDENQIFYLWTRCRLLHGRLPFLPAVDPHIDHVRAVPASYDDTDRMTRFGSFDRILFLVHKSSQGLHHKFNGYSWYYGITTYRLQGYEAGRVRAIFELPWHISYMYNKKLVYIEHFRPFSECNPWPHSLYSMSHALNNGVRKTSVIPLLAIQMSCHLTPHY